MKAPTTPPAPSQAILTPRKTRKGRQRHTILTPKNQKKQGRLITTSHSKSSLFETPVLETKHIHQLLGQFDNHTPNNHDVYEEKKKTFLNHLEATKNVYRIESCQGSQDFYQPAKDSNNTPIASRQTFDIDHALHQITEHYRLKAKKLTQLGNLIYSMRRHHLIVHDLEK